MKTTDIKGKPYVEVNERLKYFRANFAGYRLLSKIVSNGGGVVVMKAWVEDDSGNAVAVGHAYEKEGSTFINKTSFIENCETSAWGRALANFGIGIDAAVASADEVQTALANQHKDGDKTPNERTESDGEKTSPATKGKPTGDQLKAIMNAAKEYDDSLTETEVDKIAAWFWANNKRYGGKTSEAADFLKDNFGIVAGKFLEAKK